MKLLKFEQQKDRVQAELELVQQIKAAVYQYSNLLTVAQVIGCIRIAELEIIEEQ